MRTLYGFIKKKNKNRLRYANLTARFLLTIIAE